MPQFLPFVGTRYNSSRVELADVVAPPYDVISSERREVLYERDPHNIVRLDFCHDSDPYSCAGRELRQWKQQGILITDQRPAMYVYRQLFDVAGLGQVSRTGVIGRLKLSPYSEHEVIPHERTHSGPKEDRFRLMEATAADLSPIFGLISDDSFLFDQTLELATVAPALVDIDERLQSGELVRHLLWRLDDPAAEERLSKIVAHAKIYIADGHHRYETALNYAARHPEVAAAQYVMMFISNLAAPGTVVLPTYRLLYGAQDFNQYRFLEALRKTYDIVPIAGREEGIELLDREANSITLIEFPEEPKYVLVSSRNAGAHELPATEVDHILRAIVGLSETSLTRRENLLYPHTLDELDEMKEERAWDAAFLLRSVRPDELLAVVGRGEFMPQKTTYFYPKLLTGLVLHEFNEQE